MAHEELTTTKEYIDGEAHLSLELYRDDNGLGIWLSDNVGGSGISVTGTTPDEICVKLAPYICDYFYK